MEHDQLRAVVTRLRDEQGMTLIEMLVAVVIMMIVALASFTLIEVTMRRTAEIGGRVDTVERGRGAMDQITRQVRSQVCVQRSDDSTMVDDRAVYAATPTSLAFFTDLSDESIRTGNVLKDPELHTLSFQSGQLIERDYASSSKVMSLGLTKYAYSGYPNSPTRTRVLLTDVTNVWGSAAAPIFFRYYAFDTTTAPQPALELVPPVAGMTVANLALISKVSVAYKATPAKYKVATTRGNTVFNDDVYVRSADPNSTTIPKPICA